MGVAGQYTIRRYGIRRLDHNRMPRLGDLDLSTMSCRLGIPPVTRLSVVWGLLAHTVRRRYANPERISLNEGD